MLALRGAQSQTCVMSSSSAGHVQVNITVCSLVALPHTSKVHAGALPHIPESRGVFAVHGGILQNLQVCSFLLPLAQQHLKRKREKILNEVELTWAMIVAKDEFMLPGLWEQILGFPFYFSFFLPPFV